MALGKVSCYIAKLTVFRCRAYCGTFQLAEAEEDALRVLDMQPDNIDGLLALSQVKMLYHDYQSAEKTLVHAQQLAPGTFC